jgi:hypothetical protein
MWRTWRQDMDKAIREANMAMTRQHVKTIAAVLAKHMENGSQAGVAYDLAKELPRWYPNFNATKFLKDCGVQK